MKKYEKIDHTADIGIRAYGRTTEELFNNAAAGMISLIFGNNLPEPLSDFSIEIKGDDREELLVNFLEEILYHLNVNRFACTETAVTLIEDNYLTAQLKGELFNETKHCIHYDIKGVTFHLLKFEKREDMLTVQVIFDI